MAAPVTPSDFEALLTSEGDSLCKGLVNLLKLSYLWYRLIRWMVNEDGTATTDFATTVCKIECPDAGETPGSSTA